MGGGGTGRQVISILSAESYRMFFYSVFSWKLNTDLCMKISKIGKQFLFYWVTKRRHLERVWKDVSFSWLSAKGTLPRWTTTFHLSYFNYHLTFRLPWFWLYYADHFSAFFCLKIGLSHFEELSVERSCGVLVNICPENQNQEIIINSLFWEIHGGLWMNFWNSYQKKWWKK